MSNLGSDDEVSQMGELPSLSEVGCNSNAPRGVTESANQEKRTNNTHVFEGDTEMEKWRFLLEQQNKNFMAIVQAIKTPSGIVDVRLPDFDPEKRNVDPRAWLATADMCVIDPNSHGASLMIALSRALKGEASSWLSSISYPWMKWSDFKELFIARYDCPETTASFLINLHANKPKENECLAAYAATLMTTIMSKWNGLTTEQIAVATVLAHIAKNDTRVQRLSFTTDIKTRNDLHRELKAVSFLKRSAPSGGDEHDGSDAKRNRPNWPNSGPKCFNCGKLGHRSVQCRLKRDLRAHEEQSRSTASSSGKSNQVPGKADWITCFNCREQGHFASSCPKRNAKEASSSTAVDPAREKRVDMCLVDAPAGSLRHSGEQFDFYYDSGAECSLVKESVSCKFSGRRIYGNVTLTGIGQTSVRSTVQILTTVEIDGIIFETIFSRFT